MSENIDDLLGLPTLKFKRVKGDVGEAAKLPIYGSEGAACFDLHNAQGFTRIPPGQAKVIRIGLAVEIPSGMVMHIFSRSGHAFNHDVRLANGVAVIDADFRGELLVKLRNDGQKDFDIDMHDRVCQAKVEPCTRWAFEEVDELTATVRGENGGGSTGR